MVTVTVSARLLQVFVMGEQRGIGGQLASDIPRMRREVNLIGASHGAPFRPKPLDVGLELADFRLYDRSLSAAEASALFHDPSIQCCLSASVSDTFGVSRIDLTASAMAALAGPAAVAVTPVQLTSTTDVDAANPTLQPCLSEAALPASRRGVDICGEGGVTTIEDTNGVISDGVGPYIR
eukprot:SAG22_NODE_420_length_10739_cov_7.090320_6_plen_180_part_00